MNKTQVRWTKIGVLAFVIAHIAWAARWTDISGLAIPLSPGEAALRMASRA